MDAVTKAASEGPKGRLRADKHDAIMAGGTEVFARDGYQRASIDAIAAAAKVSTRTIYKHFADKAALFAAVVADSATRIADEEVELIGQHLADLDDPQRIESALSGFAVAWTTGTTQSATHRALVGQVHAEAAHLGHEVVEAWWQAGPGRVLAELSVALQRWGDAGWLPLDDAERAAVQFAQLVSARPGPPARSVPEAVRKAWIADGVGVFVRAHRR
ncbi:MAG TPA: TetR/AcrR family transcriptional regulator [Candidatus Avipropionibacterium avicola]|uniref:TetR/AcrR family transcriptional regulator n=1 Tax=Candidatus Avipropionibacterium avicola TaxID=2840701 RepID=A0A9D1KN89_9ACTN|nr:TetR/AcrR family transcriptional regulator [Candidatus Avipropionibacterium avicola]